MLFPRLSCSVMQQRDHFFPSATLLSFTTSFSHPCLPLYSLFPFSSFFILSFCFPASLVPPLTFFLSLLFPLLIPSSGFFYSAKNIHILSFCPLSPCYKGSTFIFPAPSFFFLFPLLSSIFLLFFPCSFKAFQTFFFQHISVLPVLPSYHLRLYILSDYFINILHYSTYTPSFMSSINKLVRGMLA